MLNKEPDPHGNRRLRQSISEWGPGGVGVIQEGGRRVRVRPGANKQIVKVMKHSCTRGRINKGSKKKKTLEIPYKTNLPASREAEKPPRLRPTCKTRSKSDHLSKEMVHLRFEGANILIPLLLKTTARLSLSANPCARHPLLQAPVTQTSCVLWEPLQRGPT